MNVTSASKVKRVAAERGIGLKEARTLIQRQELLRKLVAADSVDDLRDCMLELLKLTGQMP